MEVWDDREQLRAMAEKKTKGTVGLKDGFAPHLSDAMDILNQVWEEKVTRQSIKNCWENASFFKSNKEKEGTTQNTIGNKEEKSEAIENVKKLLATKNKSSPQDALAMEIEDSIEEMNKTFQACNNQEDIQNNLK